MSRRRRGRRPSQPSDAFWGRHDDVHPAAALITPTLDPSAIPRSLGDPPLSSNAAAAQHHLAVVYEEAVKAATALAAANGLLDAGLGSEEPDG